MRTTVTISDDLYSRARIQAIHEGCTVGSILEAALAAYLQPGGEAREAPLPALPTFDCGAVRPGIDLDDRSALDQVLDEGVGLDALR